MRKRCCKEDQFFNLGGNLFSYLADHQSCETMSHQNYISAGTDSCFYLVNISLQRIPERLSNTSSSTPPSGLAPAGALPILRRVTLHNRVARQEPRRMHTSHNQSTTPRPALLHGTGELSRPLRRHASGVSCGSLARAEGASTTSQYHRTADSAEYVAEAAELDLERVRSARRGPGWRRSH